jgi:aminoglycoside 3-N-acetyltransferase I
VAHTFKHLRAPDLALARALMALFAQAFDDRDTYLGHAPSDAYLTDLLGKPHVLALVALDGDTVVGGLVAYQLDKFEQARSEIYIYDLAVDERHRRQGVATGLIRALGDIAKQRGAWVMYVQADPIDPPAIALYQKLGTREDVHHFDIPVST